MRARRKNRRRDDSCFDDALAKFKNDPHIKTWLLLIVTYKLKDINNNNWITLFTHVGKSTTITTTTTYDTTSLALSQQSEVINDDLATYHHA